MVAFSVIWLNAFAPKSGMYSTYSPRATVCGTNLTYKNHCKIPFGTYAQTCEDNSPTNSMGERTIGAIEPLVLLLTSKGDTMERRAKQEGQDGEIIFTNRAGKEIVDITNANQYEDWPAEANLTGVDLQQAQDQVTTLGSYNNIDDNDDEHIGKQQTTKDPEVGPSLPEEDAPTQRENNDTIKQKQNEESTGVPNNEGQNEESTGVT
eukprot:8369495-Ditylum_brightwellii.AAC.1